MPRGGKRPGAGRKPTGAARAHVRGIRLSDRELARAEDVLHPRESLAALFREAGMWEVARREARRKR